MRLLALAAKCWRTALSAMLFVMSTERPSKVQGKGVFITIRPPAVRVVEAVVCNKAKGWNLHPLFVYCSSKITIGLHRSLEFFSHSWLHPGLYRF
jgi:hypothetical protein